MQASRTQNYALRDALDFLEVLREEWREEQAEQSATGVADNAGMTPPNSIRTYEVAINQLSGYLGPDERKDLRFADWATAGVRLANERSIAPETAAAYVRRCKALTQRLELEYNY